MMLFLILAPFGTFAVLMLTTTPVISLFSAAAVAVATIGYDVARGRTVKALAAGAALLFAAIGSYVAVWNDGLSGYDIRLAVDLGVLLIALGSLVLRVPFTLQYAREAVDVETARLPAFLHTNYVLSWAWTGAFVLMLVADIAAICAPELPLWIGIGLAFAARNGAIWFTRWYPQHRRSELAILNAPTA
jgi:hypothetical protein